MKLKMRAITNYKRYLTRDEFRRIEFWVATKLFKTPPTQMAFYTQMYLGLRISEVLTLKRHNFSNDFSRLTFMPLKKKQPIIHERAVPEVLREKLVVYNRKFNHRFRDGYMFPPFRNGSKNKHIKRSTIHHWWKKLRQELGDTKPYYTKKNGQELYRLSSHVLRHNFAFMVYEKTNDLKLVQELLCHSDVSITSAYISAIKSRASGYEKKVLNEIF